MDEDTQREVCEKIRDLGYLAEPDRNGNIYVGESAEQIDEALQEAESRAKDVIIIGGGSGDIFSLGMHHEMKTSRRIGVGMGGLGIKFAALALAQSIEIGCVAEPEHDWLYESQSKPKPYSTHKQLSAGERKTRNKKLKSQRSARRYNRKG